MNVITISEMLTQMEQTDRNGKPIPFSIDFVTCDERTGEGGDIMVFDKATLVFPNRSMTRKFSEDRKYSMNQTMIRQGKAPDHVKNGTINLMTAGNVVTKCSIWLIRYFNGQKVIMHAHG